MAVRTMTLDAWMKASNRGRAKPSDYVSPGAVGNKLGITRQAVHDAIGRGRLDAIRLTDGQGKLLALLISEASVDAYVKVRQLRQA